MGPASPGSYLRGPGATLKRATLLVLLLIAGRSAAGAERSIPLVRITASELRVALPGSILRGRDMEKQLSSGLTTLLVTTVEARSGKGTVRGGARIEIRYELWDEKYLVTLVDLGGRHPEQSFASAAELMSWTAATSLRIASSGSDASLSAVTVRVDVVPFSAREEADAQRWLIQSASTAAGASAPSSNAQAAPATNSIAVLDAIIGSTVRRRSIRSWRWVVKATRE